MELVELRINALLKRATALLGRVRSGLICPTTKIIWIDRLCGSSKAALCRLLRKPVDGLFHVPDYHTEDETAVLNYASSLLASNSFSASRVSRATH